MENTFLLGKQSYSTIFILIGHIRAKSVKKEKKTTTESESCRCSDRVNNRCSSFNSVMRLPFCSLTGGFTVVTDFWRFINGTIQ